MPPVASVSPLLSWWMLKLTDQFSSVPSWGRLDAEENMEGDLLLVAWGFPGEKERLEEKEEVE